ncbi:MAG: hypothetical protein ACYC96_11255 [Fimbriimonadaceae bacterium]
MRLLAWILIIFCFGAGCSHPKPIAATDPAAATNMGSGASSSAAPISPSPPAESPAPPSGSVKSVDPEPGAEVDVNPAAHKVPSSKVPPLSTEGWDPSKLSPMNIATRIDAAFRGLKSAAADVRLTEVLPIGSGNMITYGKFVDNKTFAVTYPIVDGTPPHLVRVGVIANRGEMTQFHPGTGKNAYSPVHPVRSGGSLNGADVLAKWSTDMPRLTMSHFITGKDVFVPLVKALQAPGSGFSVTSQERTATLNGEYYNYDRILASRRDPKSNKMLAQYEIVVDAHHFVPLTMRTRWTPPGKNATIVEWAGRWTDLKPNADDYRLPG